ncbi:class F sortase [Streptomyces longispororuber]|uniref:class F sortase n=1 Tax=Streptomyces longispororuber TaxID=68230 RepID=UPI0036F9347F
MSGPEPGSGRGAHGTSRLVMGLAWAVLLVGLWLWGNEITDARGGLSDPTTGDVAAVGRPAGVELPAPREPLPAARPLRVDVPALGVRAPVVARGLDADGAIDPPSYARPGVVGWYGGGVRPGAAGVALFVGHVDTESRPAVFYHLSAIRPGQQVGVVRDDGSVAEFTVDDVRVLSREDFDAGAAYGPRERGRAEIRLITCGGSFDRASRTYSANVVVSAYLTGVAGP